MTSQSLAARSAVPDVPASSFAGLRVELIDNATIANIAVAKGKQADLQAALRNAYGLALPSEPKRVAANGVAVVWSGPDQWLAIAERTHGRDLETELKPRLAGLAAVVDLSDARAILRIAGPRAREVMAKGVPVDLHPREFKPGDVAITHASHIGVIVCQIDEAPSYDILVPRSFAASFMHWLTASAAGRRA